MSQGLEEYEKTIVFYFSLYLVMDFINSTLGFLVITTAIPGLFLLIYIVAKTNKASRDDKKERESQSENHK
tara:strand:+ start:37309 stop:37521 length:213 start_codon:yes stop_codon:yes gene_type:complete